MSDRALSLLKLALLAAASLSPLASAQALKIVVDGQASDWATSPNCVNANGSLNITKACVENNNTPTQPGYLFNLFQASQSFPNNSAFYIGFSYDSNGDGVINSSDEAFALYFPRNSGSTPTALAVFNPRTGQIKRQYTSTTSCGGSGANNSWSGRKVGSVIEMSVGYSCLGLTSGNDYRLIRMGVSPQFDLTSRLWYNGTTDSIVPRARSTSVPQVSLATALAVSASNTVYWTNPAAHDGVLVLRSTVANATGTPSGGTAYTKGQTIGQFTVAYVEPKLVGNTTASFTDPGLTNGTKYFYKVFNYQQNRVYATSGTAPVISSTPTAGAPGAKWCYSVGYPTTQRPVVLPGRAVYSSGNLQAVTANTVSGAAEGPELWRPSKLAGAVQSQFPLIGFHGALTVPVIVTGDQSGIGWAVDANTGAVKWKANGGAALGNAIQAPPSFVMWDYASAAFKAAQPTDLVIFSTRNTSATSNKVVAASSADGHVVWSFAPGNMDIVSGAASVDMTNDRVWVASRSNGGKQPSVWVLDSKSGALVTSLNLGDMDFAPGRDWSTQQMYLTSNSGMVYGIDSTTYATVWSLSLGAAPTSPMYLTGGGGFIVTLSSGAVRRYSVSAGVVTQVWSTNVAGPGGIAIDYVAQKVYVGSSDGKIHLLDYVTGLDEKQAVVSTSAVGTPALDPSVGRILVGSLDGRLCSFALPL